MPVGAHRVRQHRRRHALDRGDDVDLVAVLAAPELGLLLRAEAHLLDEEDGVGRVHQRLAADRHAGVADLADADAGDALLVVVGLERGEVVGRAVLGRVEHVERVDDDEPDLLLLDQVAVLADEVVPGVALVILALEDEDVGEHLLRELGLVEAGGGHADLGHARAEVVAAGVLVVVKALLGDDEGDLVPLGGDACAARRAPMRVLPLPGGPGERDRAALGDAAERVLAVLGEAERGRAPSRAGRLAAS